MNTQAMKLKAQQRLIEAGCAQYHDAVIAMQAFQQEMQGRTREVVMRRLSALTSTLNVEIGENEIVDYLYPLKSTDDASYCWIGVWFTQKVGFYWAHYFGLSFDRDENGKSIPHITAALEFDRVAPTEFAFRKCKALKMDVEKNGREIYLSLPTSPQKVDLYEENLGMLIEQWINFWKSVGGVRKLPSK